MLDRFIAEVKQNAIARTNRYAVMMTLPYAVTYNGAFQTLEKALLFCDQVQLPGANFSTVQNRSFGEFREIPYEKLYEQVNMSFYVDSDMKIKDLFDSWHDGIYNPTSRTFNYYKNYVADMIIEVQNLDDESRFQVNLYECYPKTISPIQLDYSSKDVMKMQVTMQYKYWTSTTIGSTTEGQPIVDSMVESQLQDFDRFQEQFNTVLADRAEVLNLASNELNIFTGNVDADNWPWEA